PTRKPISPFDRYAGRSSGRSTVRGGGLSTFAPMRKRLKQAVRHWAGPHLARRIRNRYKRRRYMDALALLKEDHDKAKKLMEELAQTSERGVKTRQEKWTKLLKELTIHENIEEEIFYPALAENQKLKDIVLEALEEHHLVDDIVEQLKGTPFEDEHCSAKFKVTKE